MPNSDIGKRYGYTSTETSCKKCNSKAFGENGTHDPATYWITPVIYFPMQYNTIQYNTIQYNAMQCNAMQCNAMQCNAIRYVTLRYVTLRYVTLRYDTIRYNSSYPFLKKKNTHTIDVVFNIGILDTRNNLSRLKMPRGEHISRFTTTTDFPVQTATCTLSS